MTKKNTIHSDFNKNSAALIIIQLTHNCKKNPKPFVLKSSNSQCIKNKNQASPIFTEIENLLNEKVIIEGLNYNRNNDVFPFKWNNYVVVVFLFLSGEIKTWML